MPWLYFQTCMSDQRLAFPNKGLSIAIRYIGMFILKEINRLKIIQDVIVGLPAKLNCIRQYFEPSG